MVAPAARERQRLPRGERRSQLLEAAAKVFADRDPAEVTFEEIADAAGVSRALFYNYFRDRNGLLEAIHRLYVERLRLRVQAGLAGASGENALGAAVRAHVEFAADDPDGYRYAAGRVPFAGVSAIMDNRRIELAPVYGGGTHADLVAVGTFAVIESMVLHWLDHGGPADSPLSADDLVALLTALLMTGLQGLVAQHFPIDPHYPTG
ncbi:MAG TPA: TetR/AcrR family transcriptional regulator [Acidimicrobiales bacterium]